MIDAVESRLIVLALVVATVERGDAAWRAIVRAPGIGAMPAAG